MTTRAITSNDGDDTILTRRRRRLGPRVPGLLPGWTPGWIQARANEPEPPTAAGSTGLEQALRHVIETGMQGLPFRPWDGLATLLAHALEVDHLAIAEVDGPALHVLSAHGIDAEITDQLASGELPVVMDLITSGSARRYGPAIGADRGEGLPGHHGLLAPLVVERSVVGALVIGSGEQGPCPGSAIDAVMLLAGQLSLLMAAWEAQRERERLELARREINELKDAFLSLASHELRTPLTAIMGGAETLQQVGARLEECQRAALTSAMHRNALRLLSTLYDMHALRQLDSDDRPPGLEHVSMRELIAPVKQVRADHVVFDGDPEQIAEVDTGALRDVLNRLLENAEQWAPGVPVTVTWSACPSFVTIAVSDAGPGIPVDAADRVFERYHQLAPPLAHQRGLGLGLSIARDLCQRMGGDLVLETTPGAGASFVVRVRAGTALLRPAAATG